MGLDKNNDCFNEKACALYGEAWELYEIILLKGLPGAIYLCWHGRDCYCDYWANESGGFRRLNNWDWLLYYAAALNDFEEWQTAYHKFTNKRNSKFVRSDAWDKFERLRNQVDQQYCPTLDDIPF